VLDDGEDEPDERLPSALAANQNMPQLS